MQALEKERKLPLTGWQQEVDQAKRFGLEAAESIVDRNISTFSRGELPHFAGINTFMKAPYLEDVNQVGNYDVAIVGVPHDCGTTYRPGTRFGPQGIRRISALYTPYNYEMGVDVAIEMNDSHFFVAEMATHATHRGETDRVVATEDDREGAAREHVGDAFGDLIETLFVVGRDREDVTHIAEGDLFTQVDPHFVVVWGVKR